MNPNQPSDTSQKQLTANQSNAKKSTGPKTPEGKAKSSQNARKHGFTASQFAVIRVEDLDEVARLRADLIHDYQPQSSQELFTIERIALAQQTLLRLARLEAGLLTSAFNFGVDKGPLEHADVIGGIDITRDQNRNYALAEGFQFMNQRSQTWSLYLRYKGQAERDYQRALAEFDRLKSLRKDLPNEPITDPEPEETKEDLPTEPQPLMRVERDQSGRIHTITTDLTPQDEIRNLPKGEI